MVFLYGGVKMVSLELTLEMVKHILMKHFNMDATDLDYDCYVYLDNDNVWKVIVEEMDG